MGAGVAEVRVMETVVTGSESTLSALGTRVAEDKDAEEWAAVACIAFMSKLLFWFLFKMPEELVAFFLIPVSDILSTPLEAKSSCLLLESSESEGSAIGQTKPVRGA